MESPVNRLRTEKIEHKTALDVINALMDKSNIELKTEITNPYALDTLMVFAKHLKEHGYKEGYEILKYWKSLLLEYMVSNKRQSRVEISEILKGFIAVEKQKEINFGTNLANLD